MSDRFSGGEKMTQEFSPGTVAVTPQTGEIVAIHLQGEFDLATTPSVLEEAERRLDEHKHLILDLNEATFIDSSVINVIVRAHRTASERGRVAVLELGPNAVVERALDVSGITKIVPRAYSRADAIHTIHRAADPGAAETGPRAAATEQNDSGNRAPLTS
jgi:anti-sigma B factor antagonist